VGSSHRWPETVEELVDAQLRLAGTDPSSWRPSEFNALRIASAWVCFARGASGAGAAGDPAWAAAVMMCGQRVIERAVVRGAAAGSYVPGLLGLRIGSLLCEALGRLVRSWDVLLVDATGRDHPRRAGLALQLGAVLGQPSVGVTNRALVADGAWPKDSAGAIAPLLLDGETVGFWLRSRAGARPIAVHAGWCTDPDTALAVVMTCTGRVRTPDPLRQARRVARQARAGSSSNTTN
jgi:deoxyribonuclease V